MNIGGRRVRLVRDNKRKRNKNKIYGQDVLVALKEIWKIGDYICSKRLAPYLSEIIPVLEKWGEIKLDAKVRKKLFKISAATIDVSVNFSGVVRRKILYINNTFFS